ncbi:nitroreductase family protein [Peptoniphilus stercorisuis]|uniref:Nitroreductase/NAD-dependent dihydropyrimidine dehydrogenase PreA subunit n=1 Tax=Peptoniphilus stercorisuis TaxID=1436965 RepID=A0ABS4KBZ0_9FIRM|nr:nitroreductase family protein [Peptoniphilus stercorisuis]MBP2025293.1 nitroreductase/NAD-dependent dihydropyrimidine dehydrogenase PreA subunit [Peptoniphilus stercorisuis]
MENKILVNIDKCIGCKKCVIDCPMSNIIIKDKKAIVLSNDCLICGHCQAICPKNAIEITGFDEDIEEVDKYILNPEEYLRSIKTRRTIRDFRDDDIDDYIINQIIESGRYAPTARNAQDVSFIILKDKKDEFENIAVLFFRRLIKVAKVFSVSLRKINIDDNFFFKDAPIVILVVSKNKIDGSLASQNMATMAESYDLGVLFSGFFTVISRHSKKIKRELNLNRKEKVVMTLVIGKANVKYLRTTNKEDAKVLKL